MGKNSSLFWGIFIDTNTTEIKAALHDYFKKIVDINNNGLFATHQMSPKSAKILFENRISVEGDTLYMNNSPMFLIKTNYSCKGFGEELMPTLIAIEDDMPDIEVSSGRDR